MKINFTKKQYWHLMRAMYLADWVANSFTVGEKGKDLDIEALVKHVYSHAKDFGLGEYVDTECYPTCELDEHPDIQNKVDAYNEEVFWQELFYKFVDRDVERAKIEKVGYGKGDKTHKWIAETQPLYDKWGEEFEKYGIDRLEVVGRVEKKGEK